MISSALSRDAWLDHVVCGTRRVRSSPASSGAPRPAIFPLSSSSHLVITLKHGESLPELNGGLPKDGASLPVLNEGLPKDRESLPVLNEGLL